MIVDTNERPVADGREGGDRQSFLGSHRALGACTREFARLADDIVKRVTSLEPALGEEKPVVRNSPGRCIAQLGPVAITLAWLRSTLDSVADGQLMVIVWRGVVAPALLHRPERMSTKKAALPATALWEEVLRPVAANEASWLWESAKNPDMRYSSAELAELCVERLRLARAE